MRAGLRAMSEAMRQELERIFRLPGLLYAANHGISLGAFDCNRNNVTVYDNAIGVFFGERPEFAIARSAGAAVFGGRKVSPAGRERRSGERLVARQTKWEEREQAVADLVFRARSVAQSCAPINLPIGSGRPPE